jgi:hypothetical protein
MNANMEGRVTRLCAPTALPEINCQYIAVPRLRGQQLKDQSHLDGWLRDGSAAHVESLCAWK